MVQKLVTVHVVARTLGCSRDTVRRMLRAQQIPGIKIGPGQRDWRVDLDAVLIAMSSSRQPQSKPK